MNPYNFRRFIIRPVLKQLAMYSMAAENLLIGTVAQESKFGRLKQIKGVALGFYQIEPATYRDHMAYLNFRPRISDVVTGFAGRMYSDTYIPPEEVIGNLFYATAIARIHYYRKPEPLPEEDDIEGLAHYWKAYYNTIHGAGTVEEFIKSYEWAEKKSYIEG